MGLIAYVPTGAVALTANIDAGPMPELKAVHDGDSRIAAAYDNGFWVRLPDGDYRNASKRMIREAESMWSVKFARGVLGSTSPWKKVVGQPLEIGPLEAPTSVTGKIRVRVLFRGRPLIGTDIVAMDGANFKGEGIRHVSRRIPAVLRWYRCARLVRKCSA